MLADEVGWTCVFGILYQSNQSTGEYETQLLQSKPMPRPANLMLQLRLLFPGLSEFSAGALVVRLDGL